MIQYISTFIAGFATILIMDSIWLGYVVKGFIIREFGTLIEVLPNGSIKFSLPVGLLTWAIIALGCYIFAVHRSSSLSESLIYGAIFGGISYAIYDLTNLAFIKGYSSTFAMADIAWGVVLCAAVSGVMYKVWHIFS